MATQLDSPGVTGLPQNGKPFTVDSGRPTKANWLPYFKWTLVSVPFLFLWVRLVGDLQREWGTNPQYGYGFVMPLLCLGALFGRFQKKAGNQGNLGGCESKSAGTVVTLWMAALTSLFLPIRLVEEATPEWRPIQWALGVVAIGLTLGAFYLVGGRSALKRAAFPLAFFFVAIPWPTLIEEPVIQGLSRLNSGLVVEVLGILGVPAVQHGNLIEVSTGVVGVNDACSGIRSFQSSLMISLFLGEINVLSTWRRWFLVPAGFTLSILFNLCRTTFLAYIASSQGMAAIAQYHDPAGVAIMIACLVSIWVLAFLLKPRQARAASTSPPPPTVSSPRPSPFYLRPLSPGLQRAALALCVWIIAVEASVQAWYHFRETGIVQGPNWSVAFPTANATFKDLPISPETRELLRYDKGKTVQWWEADGTVWNVFYFEWFPGRVAAYLAKRHTPDICMPATGRKQVSGPDLMVMTINGVELPMRRYIFRTPTGGSVHAYQCRWEASVARGQYVANESARFNLIRGIWAGRGIHGQKVLEVVVTGIEDLDQSKLALLSQLEKLIRVETVSGSH